MNNGWSKIFIFGQIKLKIHQNEAVTMGIVEIDGKSQKMLWVMTIQMRHPVNIFRTMCDHPGCLILAIDRIA